LGAAYRGGITLPPRGRKDDRSIPIELGKTDVKIVKPFERGQGDAAAVFGGDNAIDRERGSRKTQSLHCSPGAAYFGSWLVRNYKISTIHSYAGAVAGKGKNTIFDLAKEGIVWMHSTILDQGE
jgi:hypothetical protein